MEKLLPIKFFEKRRIDEQLTEAGGNKDLPKWVLQGKELERRSRRLAGSMEQVADRFETHKRERRGLPMVMATTISEKALAKTHRQVVADLLESDRLSNVIGVESLAPAEPESKETRRLLSIVTTDELVDNIGRALRDTNNNARLISSIKNLEPFEAGSARFDSNNSAYRVRLIDYKNHHSNQLARTLFRNSCAASGITIERETRYSADMRIYRVVLNSAADMEALLGFEGVYSVEEAIPIEVDVDGFGDNRAPGVKRGCGPVEVFGCFIDS